MIPLTQMIKGGLLFMLALGPQTPSAASLYGAARKYDKESFHYAPPTEARVADMRALVQSLTKEALAGRARPSARDLARAHVLELQLVDARDAGGALWVLREAGNRRAGDGLYVFRPGGAPVCVQAPHTFFDEGTGDIALAVAADLRAVALFANTVHRYAPVVAGAAESAADVAHAPRSLFRAATEGLLAARALPIIQLHGFGPSEALPADAAAVVADGASTRPPDAPAARLRSALAEALARRVLLYGVDAHELGATTNIEGRAAREAGAPFLHVEMSRATRSDAARAATALAGALRRTLSLER
jgi:hypothetical protein